MNYNKAYAFGEGGQVEALSQVTSNASPNATADTRHRADVNNSGAGWARGPCPGPLGRPAQAAGSLPQRVPPPPPRAPPLVTPPCPCSPPVPCKRLTAGCGGQEAGTRGNNRGSASVTHYSSEQARGTWVEGIGRLGVNCPGTQFKGIRQTERMEPGCKEEGLPAGPPDAPAPRRRPPPPPECSAWPRRQR